MLGSTIHPQGFGDFRQEGPSGITTCAWGAAHDAVGNHDDYENDPENWRWASKETETVCPECGLPCIASVGCAIVHLNDYHRWTRERIAEWVRSVEPKEPEAALDANEYTIMEKVRDEAVSD
jgi:hypothetical protein